MNVLLITDQESNFVACEKIYYFFKRKKANIVKADFANYRQIIKHNYYDIILVYLTRSDYNLFTVTKNIKESYKQLVCGLVDEDYSEEHLDKLDVDHLVYLPVDESRFYDIILHKVVSVKYSYTFNKKYKIYPISLQIYEGEKEIKLRRKEFELLFYLINNKDKVITKAELLQNIWKYSSGSIDTNTIGVHLNRLKKKIDLSCLESIYGIGYKMDSDATIESNHPEKES